jgi:hypothetical protein
MQRRKFLTAAVLAAMAGCSGNDTEEMDEPAEDETEESQNTTMAAEETTEQTDGEETTEANEEDETEAEGEPAVEIVEHELVVNEGEYSTDAYIAATIENTGDGASGMIELTADWYDEAGDYMDNDSAYLRSLGAGETWAARVYFLGSGAEEVDSYEIDGEFETDHPTFDPEGLELVEQDMKVGDNEAVIEGQVENNTGEEASYIQAIGKIYDANGVVLGDSRTNVTDVPDGETWTFDFSWRGRDRTDQADDYEVLITDSVS